MPVEFLTDDEAAYGRYAGVPSQEEHVQRVGQERPQVPHRGQLQRKAQTSVIPAPPGDQRTVSVLENWMKNIRSS